MCKCVWLLIIQKEFLNIWNMLNNHFAIPNFLIFICTGIFLLVLNILFSLTNLLHSFWYPRIRWYLLSLIKMSARNLHDQVDDLKNKLLYGSVAITVYSCPLNFFPKLSFNKAWSLIGDFMWWYVMPFCILFMLKNYLVIAMDKTQDLVEP